MYAIIETGGKQFKVQAGDVIEVEKLGVTAGDTYNFDKVILVNNEGQLNVGTPYVAGATVTATVVGDFKGKKIVVYKYKRKIHYHKKKGHRQPFTRVKIESIQ